MRNADRSQLPVPHLQNPPSPTDAVPRSSHPSSTPTQQRPNPYHLLECMSSATSIIAIFDLFCRTFGDDYCILSLSYSVYIAASIFLLQVQAVGSGIQDEITLRRLEFCVGALRGVRGINAGESFTSFCLPLFGLGVHSRFKIRYFRGQWELLKYIARD